MSDYRLAFSHLLVAGSTIWCVYNTHKGGKVQWEWIYGTYAPLCAYSFAGIFKYGNPEYGDEIHKYYSYMEKLVQSFALPSFVTETYIKYNFDPQYAAIHVALPVIPLGIELAKNDWDQNLVDIIQAGNAISNIYISFMHDNYFGMLASINYIFTHFILRTRNIGDVPTKVFYNAGLCFFLFYSYKAMMDAGMGGPSIEAA